MHKKAFIRHFLLEFFIVILSLIFIYPIFLVILNSFKTSVEVYQNPFGLPTEFLYENYIFVWNDIEYPRKLLNSLIVTIFPLPPILLFSSMAAYRLCRTKTKLSKILFIILIATMLIPLNVIMVPLMTMANRYGLTNNLFGLILVYIGFCTPFAIFLYHGFIKNIKTDIEESSRIDGCGSFRTYLYIVFPMLKPITATITILLALTFWNDFFLPLLLISNETIKTLPLVASKYNGIYMSDWSRSLPAVVMLSVPILIFYFLVQRFILDGISQGAVKG